MFPQLSTSIAFRSSISGLSTKRDTSTLNDIIAGVFFKFDVEVEESIANISNLTYNLINRQFNTLMQLKAVDCYNKRKNKI
jgi:hypothetical protein